MPRVAQPCQQLLGVGGDISAQGCSQACGQGVFSCAGQGGLSRG